MYESSKTIGSIVRSTIVKYQNKKNVYGNLKKLALHNEAYKFG